jgi:rhamnosyltransferase
MECDVVLFVRDDCSSDDTVEKIKQFEHRLDIRFSNNSGKENLGPGMSFWSLLMEAPEADYYFFADQDDVWDSDKLRIAISEMEHYEESIPRLYCCNSRIIDQSEKLIRENGLTLFPKLNIPSQIICGEIPGCAICINRSMRNKLVGAHISSVPMHDWVVVLSALACGEVNYDEIPHYSRRMHRENVIANTDKSKYEKIKQSIENWKRLYRTQYAMISDLNNNFGDIMPRESREYIDHLLHYRKLADKIWILNSPLTEANNKNALRSFKIRMVINKL